MPPKSPAARVNLREPTPERAFGLAIRTVRNRLSLSQDELAHRTGYSRNYIGQIERGEKNPTLRVILDLAEALGTRAALLVARVEFQRSKKSS